MVDDCDSVINIDSAIPPLKRDLAHTAMHRTVTVDLQVVARKQRGFYIGIYD
jgi:hypothetical protein